MASELDPKTYAITKADKEIIDHYVERTIMYGDGENGEHASLLVSVMHVYEQGLEWNKARARVWAKAIQQGMLESVSETMFDELVEQYFENLREEEVENGVAAAEDALDTQVENDTWVISTRAAYERAKEEARMRIMAEVENGG